MVAWKPLLSVEEEPLLGGDTVLEDCPFGCRTMPRGKCGHGWPKTKQVKVLENCPYGCPTMPHGKCWHGWPRYSSRYSL